MPAPEQQTYPHADLLQWEDGQAAWAFNREGDTVEWGSHEYADPIKSRIGSILVSTESGNTYLLGGGHIIDVKQSEKTGSIVEPTNQEQAKDLPDITIGKQWRVPGFRSTSRVTGVLLKYESGEPNPAATQLGGTNLFDLTNQRMKEVAERPEAPKREVHEQPRRRAPERDAVGELSKQFAADPFSALRQESQRLFNVYQDPTTSQLEKSKLLNSYFRTIETLDRQTFPNKNGRIEKGVPKGYIPDGFIDLGGDRSVNPRHRDREMLYVDTYATLKQHKEVFESVFADMKRSNFSGSDAENQFLQTIVAHVAVEVYRSMPYGDGAAVGADGILKLSESVPAVCRQHAMTTQVLMQAFGIRSRLFKNHATFGKELERTGEEAPALGRHAANIITLPKLGEQKQYIFDATNPQLARDGRVVQGLFRMERRSKDGGWIADELAGGKRKYTEHRDAFWTIQRSK